MAERSFRRDSFGDTHDGQSFARMQPLSRLPSRGNDFDSEFDEEWDLGDYESRKGERTEAPSRFADRQPRHSFQRQRGSGNAFPIDLDEPQRDLYLDKPYEYRREMSIGSDKDNDYTSSAAHQSPRHPGSDHEILFRTVPRPSKLSPDETRQGAYSPYSRRTSSPLSRSSETDRGSLSPADPSRIYATQPSSSNAVYRSPLPFRSTTSSIENSADLSPNHRVATMAPQYSEATLAAPAFAPASNSSFYPSTLPGLKDQKFRYTPLEESVIRLIKIFPETKTMIKCEMIHVSLRNPPQYVAISYAWGDARETRNVDLQGYMVPISVSLHGALQALRLKGGPVLVWADALSIDQQNKDERTQQVQLMTSIYSSAQSVAVWLGPEEDNSTRAVDLICEVSKRASDPESVSQLLESRIGSGDLIAVISLYMRDYWKRLWVVQELYNARSIVVYCGPTRALWSNYELASDAFRVAAVNLDRYLTKEERRNNLSWNGYSTSQVLYHHGPTGLLDLRKHTGSEGALFQTLRRYREKLALDPRDKLFGLLGILPGDVRREFRADYDLSVRDVYVEIVDYVLKTTQSLDIICDAIHFPVYTSPIKLPSFAPDWSYNNDVESIAGQWDFSAAGTTQARCSFIDERLTKLKISAIYLGTVRQNGVSVGTIYRRDDFLMAFLHWRALLLDRDDKKDRRFQQRAQEDFASSLCFGQDPLCWKDPKEWLNRCYNVFSNLLRKQLPHLPLDQRLKAEHSYKVHKNSGERVQFFKDNFQYPMIGRCLCLTDNLVGLGSGFMVPGDIVVVPLGCSTPIILRAEGTRGEYRLVGDVYINGYMHGKAVDEWKSGERELTEYVLH